MTLCQWVVSAYAPVNVPLDIAQDCKETFGEVLFGIKVVLCLPCPIFSALNKVLDHAIDQDQLSRTHKLDHVYATDRNVTNR